jgi:prevent-host-death family protein
MKSVQIGELRNKLSGYLRDVRKGEEIIIRDRGFPVAKIIPYVPDSIEEQHRILIATGAIAPPTNPPEDREKFVTEFLGRPRPKVQGRVAIQALLDEREEGW